MVLLVQSFPLDNDRFLIQFLRSQGKNKTESRPGSLILTGFLSDVTWSHVSLCVLHCHLLAEVVVAIHEYLKTKN